MRVDFIFCIFLCVWGGVIGCNIDWSCEECTGHRDNCLYIKNKEGFFCVQKLLPSMRVRLIFSKADCLNLKMGATTTAATVSVPDLERDIAMEQNAETYVQEESGIVEQTTRATGVSWITTNSAGDADAGSLATTSRPRPGFASTLIPENPQMENETKKNEQNLPATIAVLNTRRPVLMKEDSVTTNSRRNLTSTFSKKPTSLKVSPATQTNRPLPGSVLNLIPKNPQMEKETKKNEQNLPVTIAVLHTRRPVLLKEDSVATNNRRTLIPTFSKNPTSHESKLSPARQTTRPLPSSASTLTPRNPQAEKEMKKDMLYVDKPHGHRSVPLPAPHPVNSETPITSRPSPLNGNPVNTNSSNSTRDGSGVINPEANSSDLALLGNVAAPAHPRFPTRPTTTTTGSPGQITALPGLSIINGKVKYMGRVLKISSYGMKRRFVYRFLKNLCNNYILNMRYLNKIGNYDSTRTWFETLASSPVAGEPELCAKITNRLFVIKNL